MNRKKIILFFLILYLLTAMVFSEPGLEISSLYYRSAVEAHSAGNDDLAIELIEKGKDFFSFSSDLLYLKSKIMSSDYLNSNLCINGLETALLADNFIFHNRDEAIFLYAVLLNRTDRPNEARQFLDLLENRYSHIPEFHYELAKSMTASDPDEEDRILRDALLWFPANEMLIKERIRTNPGFSKALVRDLQFQKHELSDTLLIYLLNKSDFNDKRIVMDTLRQYGISNPFIEFHSYIFNNIRSDISINNILSNMAFETSQTIEYVVSMINSDDIKFLAQILSRFSNVIVSDSNEDGIPEYGMQFYQGVLNYYFYDKNQNGIPDLEIYFFSGIPERILFRDISDVWTSVQYTYGDYPFVDSIAYQNESITQEFSLKNNSYSYPVLRNIRFPESYTNPVYKPGQYTFVSEHVLANLSLQRKYISADVQRIDNFFPEFIKSVVFDDKNRMSEELSYNTGEMILISKDLNQNGYAEYEEILRGSTTIQYSLDEDEDGHKDYIYNVETASEYWDYNDDGVVDLKRMETKDGSIIEYSTSWNGDLNIKVDFHGNSISSISKNSVIQDIWFEQNLVWIGKKGNIADLPVSLNTVFNSEGSSFFFFALNEVLCADYIR